MEVLRFKLDIATIECQHCKKNTMPITSNMIDPESRKYFSFTKCVCQKKTYFFLCVCTTPITSTDQFYDGQLHQCPNANCAMKFSIVACNSCSTFTLFDSFSKKEYIMGKPFECSGCSLKLQQVTCAQCKESSYFNGNYKETAVFQCQHSSDNDRHVSQHLNCPNIQCKTPNLFTQLVPFQQYICQSQSCQKSFSFMECNNCKHPIVLPTTIKPGSSYECKECKFYCTYDICPKVECQNINIRSTRETLGELGQRKCQKCSKEYNLIQCKKGKCSWFNIFEIHGGDKVFQDNCDGCKKEYNWMVCPHCKNGSQLIELDLTKSNTIDCPCCKKSVVHNINKSLVIGFDCKICIEKPAIYLIDKCSHLIACEECKNDMMIHSPRTLKCPVCREQGNFKRLYT